MIYLYTLPGVAFNAPQFSVPLIKGYLKENDIETKQFDLSIDFFEKCVKSSYIKENLKKYYKGLSKRDKKTVDNIDRYITCLKDSNINTEKIITANEKMLNYLNILSSYYKIDWKRRGLNPQIDIKTIDDVIKYARNKDNIIFDDVLVTNSELKSNDICYLSIQYPFQLSYAIRFARKIKLNNKSVKIIFGGDYITHIIKNAAELMEKCDDIDSIIFFGENKNLLKLINYYNENNSNKIPNTYIRNNNKIIINNIEKCSITDKDKYVPCFDDLDLNRYISNLKLIPLTLNYGCYHSKCSFCSRYFFYNGYSTYNLDKIFSLIKKEYINHSIQAIYFIDECVPPDILIKLANYLVDNNINIKWMVETRICKELADKRIAALLYRSGCREISFGIESYNKKILKQMNKNIDLHVAKKVMKTFFKSGISVSATFMIGYPTETKSNINRTIRFIKRFKYIDTFGLGVFNYMRNSKLVNDSNLDEQSDLNLIYRMNNDNREEYMKLINNFNLSKKINRFSKIRNKILYRSEYMYLDRNIYSLNYKK